MTEHRDLGPTALAVTAYVFAPYAKDVWHMVM